MAEQQKAVGIDLGTTYSAVAYIDEAGRPTTLVNAEGDLVTPSAVLFEGETVIVGKVALKAVATEAEQVAQCAKRDLGQRAFHKPLLGHEFPPEAILALVLTKLKQDAEEQIGEIRRVVITVPAYFDEVRRKATQDAGYIAGLEVLDIINEPTAAAITFGYHKGILGSGEQDEQKILVYDLGGGTFDVTVMEIKGTDFTTLATDGDVLLGGQDWDQRLLDYLAEEFIRTHQLDPREDPCTMGRMWRDCEDAKRLLSARAKVTLACDYQGRAIRCELTREDFEEMTGDLLDRTEFTTRQIVQAAGLTWDDIDRVLLVGGSTRMPMVMDMLSKLSGKRPDRSVSADEAVAHGAALRAKQLLDKTDGAPPAFQIHNVNSHSLGVVATDRQTASRRTAFLIPRNTPLPAAAKRVFKTQRAGQKSILVQIVEGESASPDDCSQIGKCAVRDLPPDLPARTPVNVRFRYLENGRLTVTVNVEGTDTQLKHEMTRENSLTPVQLDSWRQYVSGVTGEDGAESEPAQPEQRDQQDAQNETRAAGGPTQAAGGQSAGVAEAGEPTAERRAVRDIHVQAAGAKSKRLVRAKAEEAIPKSTSKSKKRPASTQAVEKSNSGTLAARESAEPKAAEPSGSSVANDVNHAASNVGSQERPNPPIVCRPIVRRPIASPESSAPQAPVPKSPAPASPAPASPAPQSSAPQSSAPQSSAPQSSAPQSSAPQSSAPQSSAPDLSAPEASVDDPGPPEVEVPSPAEKLAARPPNKPPRPKSAAQPAPKSDTTAPPTERETTDKKKSPSAAPPTSRPPARPKAAAQPEPKSDAAPPPTESETTDKKMSPSAAPPKSSPPAKPKIPAAASPPKCAASANHPTTQTVASGDTPVSSAMAAMSTIRDKFRFRRRSKSPQDIEEAKCAILERLENGEISAEAAAKAIERL